MENNHHQYNQYKSKQDQIYILRKIWPILKGRIKSNGKEPIDIRIKQRGKFDVDIRATDNTQVTVKSIKTVGTKLKSQWDGVTVYGEAGFNIGLGLGLDPSLLGGEVFVNGNAKFTAGFGGPYDDAWC